MTHNLEIIAEAASNHNGSRSIACALVDLAANAGASSIKFQFISAHGLYLSDFLDGRSYVPNPVFHQRQREELSDEDWQAIWDHAKERDVEASASVFCEVGLALLQRLGAPYVKIASTDLTNHALISRACAVFERVIVSTGMATLAEIDAMIRHVKRYHPGADLRLMHCVSAYPCPLPEANTQRIALLRNVFGLPVGYSDHTAGDVSAAMALVQGATFFEKHFTTDRCLPGFDHMHALDGPSLKQYVRNLNESAISLRKPANELSEPEKITRVRARRGIYAARALPAGHVLTADDLLFVRPSTEFETTDPAVLVGRRLELAVPRHAALGLVQSVGTVTSNWKGADSYWKNEMAEKGMIVKPTKPGTNNP